ncbi:hypothetical protein B0H14DRAFT_2902431 [Mycena olivaceomarginata]|nr:hypothetical protein B0H14DRAFT_2902431 [Mycena olivaceomarginata]
MPSRFITAAALALISFSTGAAAVSCGVCAPTIREEGSNTVQCNYDTPAISGFSPGCLYRNVDGVVIFTNTGPTLTSLPGACPATIPRVTKTVC